MFFLNPRRPPSGKFTTFHALIVASVLVVALVLGVSRLFRSDAPLVSDLPAVGWEEVSETSEKSVTDSQDVPTSVAEESEETIPVDIEPAPITEEETIPTSFNLAIPFTSQAPIGNWDALHEETCEEAAVYMVAEYYDGTPAGKMDVAASDTAMLDMVAYQEATGYGVSISAVELAAFIDEYYDGAYVVDIIENPSADDIRQLVADGYPVIVPAAGRLLGNPFFTGEGPLYHMLVVRGYEDGRFVTNDPGTRHGENYMYEVTIFMNAIHDWNNGDPVNGTQRVLVMSPAK